MSMLERPLIIWASRRDLLLRTSYESNTRLSSFHANLIHSALQSELASMIIPIARKRKLRLKVEQAQT